MILEKLTNFECKVKRKHEKVYSELLLNELFKVIADRPKITYKMIKIEYSILDAQNE